MHDSMVWCHPSSLSLPDMGTGVLRLSCMLYTVPHSPAPLLLSPVRSRARDLIPEDLVQDCVPDSTVWCHSLPRSLPGVTIGMRGLDCMRPAIPRLSPAPLRAFPRYLWLWVSMVGTV